MDKLNQFFRKLYSNPSLLWKAGAGLVFIGLGIAFFTVPSLGAGMERSTRFICAALLLLYGSFRFFTFYAEFKNNRDER